MNNRSDRNSESGDWDVVEEPENSENNTRVPRPKRPVLVNVDDIVLGNGGRKIDDRKVKQLERSITDQGLRYPIQIYKLGNSLKGKFGLAAGQHRLRAVKNLGFQTVPAVIIKRGEARAWRASENLHRNGLSPLEESQAIVAYAEERRRLPNVKEDVAKGGKQPNDRGYKKLANAIGYDRKRVAEAYIHVALPDSIKKAILKQRKLNKRSTLNLLAKMKTEEEQLRFTRGHSHTEPSKIKSTTKIGKPTPSKRPKSWKDSMALAALKRKWKASPFRPFYEAQPAGARMEFVRQVLN
jgi:ParB family transcriptional regulator, chromosome partitioning protein